jgi:hypothetical protein
MERMQSLPEKPGGGLWKLVAQFHATYAQKIRCDNTSQKPKALRGKLAAAST